MPRGLYRRSRAWLDAGVHDHEVGWVGQSLLGLVLRSRQVRRCRGSYVVSANGGKDAVFVLESSGGVVSSSGGRDFGLASGEYPGDGWVTERGTVGGGAILGRSSHLG